MDNQAAGFDTGQSGEENWADAQGQVRASRPAAGVVHFVFSGRMTPELVPRIRAFVDEELERSQAVSIFFDTAEMSGYHPEFRDQMTSWHEALKPRTRSADVLVRSKLVSMAIAVANLVTGGLLKSHADRMSFDRALTDACRAARRS